MLIICTDTIPLCVLIAALHYYWHLYGKVYFYWHPTGGGGAAAAGHGRIARGAGMEECRQHGRRSYRQGGGAVLPVRGMRRRRPTGDSVANRPILRYIPQ